LALPEVSERLTRCFATVFPELSPKEVAKATSENVPTWDSVTMVTLIAVVEEEFGVMFEFDDMEHLNSYGAVLEILNRRLTG
jgi:acyl carrier protein